MFADETLKGDVKSVLKQAHWDGDVDDLRRAAAAAPVTEVRLPRGTRMPFMSSRKDGAPIVLRDVLWAGDKPISAYAFEFTSSQRRYRCIIPKPCANFFVVDLGTAIPELAVGCRTPPRTLVGQRFAVYLTLVNNGTATEPAASLVLHVPEAAALVGATEQPVSGPGSLSWSITSLRPHLAKEVRATFISRQPASLTFDVSAEGGNRRMATTRCETVVAGIPAILLETSDLEDPIEVGKQVIYEIKVTNQGSAPGTNLKVWCALPESEAFLSGAGPTQVEGRTAGIITMGTLPFLAPKGQALWRTTVRALKPDDARFKVFVSSDQFQAPIRKDESTHLY